MRKLILCAAAAIVALASCTKTQVINTEEPKEIGFKTLSGVMTKAAGGSTALEGGIMGVYAYVNGETTNYFSNEAFTKETDSDMWAGGQYWLIGHNLDFVVYHPHSSVSNNLPNFNYTTKELSVDAPDKDTDYLYGAEFYNGTNDTGYDKNTTSVPVQLQHAKAKVTVNFDIDGNVGISNVKLDNQVLTGEYVVKYGNSTTVTWTPAAGTVNDVVAMTPLATANIKTPAVTNGDGSTTTPAVLFDSSYSNLVIPSTTSSISFTYTMTGGVALVYTFNDVNPTTWEHGKHYIFNVTITSKEIKFTPTVKDWDEVTKPEEL